MDRMNQHPVSPPAQWPAATSAATPAATPTPTPTPGTQNPPCTPAGPAGCTAPSGHGFIALLAAFRATGGTAPGEILGRLLEEHQGGHAVSLARRIHAGQMFGFDWRGSLWIPMFQFDANDLALKAGAQSVGAELPPLWSGWTRAAWFAAPNMLLGGHCPADMLDPDLAAVRQAARALPLADVCATLPPLRPAPMQRAHEAAMPL